MTDTDSSTPTEEPPVPKEKKKKEKKKKKDKKKSRHDATAAEDDDDGDCREKRESNDSRKEEDTREKKSKKKKKDKKRKRSISSVDDEEDATVQVIAEDSSSSSSIDKKAKKKHKKSKKKKSKHDKHHTKQHSSSSKKEIDEKVVSSSAIEYYPEDLKHLQLKKNQEEIAAVPLESSDKKASKVKVKQPKASSEDGSNGDDTCDNKIKPTSDNDDSRDNNNNESKTNNITLLLFYQYVEPPWDEDQFQKALAFVTDRGHHHGLTGRMRVAREGLNCTLTGSHDGIRGWCADLRNYDGGRSRVVDGKVVTEFANTEFKLTDDLPPKQRFPKLHAFEVVELVNYGLAGPRAPPIAQHGGTHLEPSEYHAKMCEKDTVVIDVRNHYEANIGRFDPPKEGAQIIDPQMRKSTEFPMWLDKKETKEMLRGKQVLMYCTGGVRCERASALLKQKIDQEEDTKELGIKGVYQLQGGIDKYFKEFPQGGLWKGKNYVFDKRFAHAPPAVEAVVRTKKVLGGDDDKGVAVESDSSKKLKNKQGVAAADDNIMGKCESCHKPWDMYRGKRRCPTCGVPSLICRECWEADKNGTKKLGKWVRCDLCVAQDVQNKRELRQREEQEMKEYESKLRSKLGTDAYEPPVQRKHAITRKPKPNPERITRLFLKNMCAKRMDEAALVECLHPARVTHIQWLKDRNTGKFYGSAFIEVKTAEDAGSVLAMDGTMVLGRRMKVKYQKADEKDVWPLPNTEVSSS
mmetsp:Transcript_46795/g.98284  ORF Transcript_46795/g.98284 Transcript_46795/m.98284 type:complete len:745 (+) Transcript_46795:38-2272(+)